MAKLYREEYRRALRLLNALASDAEGCCAIEQSGADVVILSAVRMVNEELDRIAAEGRAA